MLSSRFFVIPPAPDAVQMIQAGVSWFDLEHGGRIWVQRYLLLEARWSGSEVPSAQWEAATVAGRPAAVGKPLMAGFGSSSVVVWDEGTHTLTTVRATDRPIEEVLKVAEGVARSFALVPRFVRSPLWLVFPWVLLAWLSVPR